MILRERGTNWVSVVSSVFDRSLEHSAAPAAADAGFYRTFGSSTKIGGSLEGAGGGKTSIGRFAERAGAARRTRFRTAFLGFAVAGAAVVGAVFFANVLAGGLPVLAATAARFFLAPSVVDTRASALVMRAVALMKVLLAASAAFRALRAALLAFL